MLSRARKGLMIVGSTMTLKYGSKDNPWEFVIDYLDYYHAIYPAEPQQNIIIQERFRELQELEKKKNRNVDETFDVETYESNEDYKSISSISNEEISYETEELPFIKSNHN